MNKKIQRKTIDFSKTLVEDINNATLPKGFDEYINTFTARLHYVAMRGLKALKK